MSTRPLQRGQVGSPAGERGALAPAEPRQEPERPRRVWASRDPLRRRMLALADVGAAIAICPLPRGLRPGRSGGRRCPPLPPGLDPRRQAVRPLRPRPPLAPAPDGRRAADHPRLDDHVSRGPGRVPRAHGAREPDGGDRDSHARARAARGSLALRSLARFLWRWITPPGTRRRRRRQEPRAARSAGSSSSSPTCTPPSSASTARSARPSATGAAACSSATGSSSRSRRSTSASSPSSSPAAGASRSS